MSDILALQFLVNFYFVTIHYKSRISEDFGDFQYTSLLGAYEYQRTLEIFNIPRYWALTNDFGDFQYTSLLGAYLTTWHTQKGEKAKFTFSPTDYLIYLIHILFIQSLNYTPGCHKPSEPTQKMPILSFLAIAPLDFT